MNKTLMAAVAFGAACLVCCVAVAFLPYLGTMLYSLHGGPAWLLCLLCFPWYVGAVFFWGIKEISLRARWKFALLAILGYLALIVPVSILLSMRLGATVDASVTPLAVAKFLIFPLSYPFW